MFKSASIKEKTGIIGNGVISLVTESQSSCLREDYTPYKARYTTMGEMSESMVIASLFLTVFKHSEILFEQVKIDTNAFMFEGKHEKGIEFLFLQLLVKKFEDQANIRKMKKIQISGDHKHLGEILVDNHYEIVSTQPDKFRGRRNVHRPYKKRKKQSKK